MMFFHVPILELLRVVLMILSSGDYCDEMKGMKILIEMPEGKRTSWKS
jgi:hypothetical protein